MGGASDASGGLVDGHDCRGRYEGGKQSHQYEDGKHLIVQDLHNLEMQTTLS